MKFSGKMCFEIILKVTKNQGFTHSLEDAFFEKPQGEVKKVRVKKNGGRSLIFIKYFSYVLK